MLTRIDALPRTSPEQQGIASSAVLRFVEALESQIHEMHSFMLLRHGSVVAEGWWSPYGHELPHMIYSLSKSFTSTAVGLAVSEGCFSLDDTVLSFFPDETPVEMSDFLAAMCVRHLLSMSTGHAVDTWAYMQERPDGDWIKGFFDVPVRHAPGTHFLYNTGATYMLSAIVQKTTGMKLIDYLQPRLFEPLGIENATWDESPQGIRVGGIGLNIKTEDIARFGQLYLQKGMWQGKQLLSEEWVKAATSYQMSNGYGPQSDWAQG
jgi:CubicO group peptidase (beta-lactamase class C family)